MPRTEGRGVASSLLQPLRPKPFRGDVVAAGVVVLATLVWTLVVRFDDVWGAGAQLAYTAAAWTFVTTIAVLSPREGDTPRAYQSVLYVAGVALWAAVIFSLSRVLGAGGAFASPGDTTALLAALAAVALGFATRRNSAVCTLIGALAAGGAVIAGVDWVFDPHGVAPFRWVLLALMVVYGLAAIGQRDRRLRHGVALIDAAGLAVLAIAFSLNVGDVSFAGGGGRETGVAWGWELLILAAGFGLIAYSSVDRQPGPAYLGVASLAAFALITSGRVSGDGATLLGWPVALAVAAAVLLIIGLRPTTPAPPPPDVDAPEPPPLPLR
jgi:branched-subunit amino acid transport protein